MQKSNLVFGVNARYLKDIHGKDVVDLNGKEIGKVKDIEINSNGVCEHLIISVREGGELLIPFSEIKISNENIVLQTKLGH